MREKILITDPKDELYTPKTLGAYFSQKRTAQTGFVIAARHDPEGLHLWFAQKWRWRVADEFGDWIPERSKIGEDFWRIKVVVPKIGNDGWERFKDCARKMGYDISVVRSFRRFTR